MSSAATRMLKDMMSKGDGAGDRAQAFNLAFIVPVACLVLLPIGTARLCGLQAAWLACYVAGREVRCLRSAAHGGQSCGAALQLGLKAP